MSAWRGFEMEGLHEKELERERDTLALEISQISFIKKTLLFYMYRIEYIHAFYDWVRIVS